MTSETLNIRNVLEYLLEYVKTHSFVVGDRKERFVLSDDVINSSRLMRETLELCGCLQPLGRLDAGYDIMWRHTLPSQLQVVAAGRARGISFPWNRKVWVLEEDRIDEVYRQLLLSKPLLEKVQKLYGVQVDVEGRDELPTNHLPRRAEP